MGAPQPLKTVAAHGVRTWGAATSRWRPRPDFLVLGSKRGGTTTMFRALQDHPDVAGLFPAAQDKKSSHYYDLHHDRGDAWFRGHFPTERARRRPDGRSAITGEASPYYLFHPSAPAWVATDLPDARFVVMLRNPVDRAFSHHWDRVKNGIETLSFADAIEAEPVRLAGERERLQRLPGAISPAHEHFSYVARGEYAGQLRTWFDVVDRDRILVIRSEDFYEQPEKLYGETLDFLGLAPFEAEAFGKLHGHADRPAVPADVRARLDEHFAPHNRALADLLGTEVWW